MRLIRFYGWKNNDVRSSDENYLHIITRDQLGFLRETDTSNFSQLLASDVSLLFDFIKFSWSHQTVTWLISSTMDPSFFIDTLFLWSMFWQWSEIYWVRSSSRKNLGGKMCVCCTSMYASFSIPAISIRRWLDRYLSLVSTSMSSPTVSPFVNSIRMRPFFFPPFSQLSWFSPPSTVCWFRLRTLTHVCTVPND